MFIYILKFIIGLVLGSFLNVVAQSLPTGANWHTRRSTCPTCNRKLTTFELVPLLSYLILKGKCLGCLAKINPIYFWSELVSGILFMLVPLTMQAWVFTSLLITVTLTDIYYQIVPNKVLIFVSFVLIPIHSSIINAIVGFSFMLAISTISEFIWKKRTLGGGDIKLYFVIGLVLPIPSLFLSIFLASALALTYIVICRHDKNVPLPFAPFISMGAYISYLWGDSIINWYLNLIQISI